MTRAALYVRVSTDRQTVENQTARMADVAAARGWEVVGTYADEGISGAKGRDKRPGLDKLLKHASKRKFDVVMVWAIDRLGRSLVDLLGTIQHLEACGVDLYVDQQSIDTTTPTGKLVFHIVGAIAEFERELIRSRIHAGLARARAKGRKPGQKVDRRKIDEAARMLSDGASIHRVRAATGLGAGTIQRLRTEVLAAQIGATPAAPCAPPAPPPSGPSSATAERQP